MSIKSEVISLLISWAGPWSLLILLLLGLGAAGVLLVGRAYAASCSELAARNRDLRLVLDHVSQGFLTVDLAGVPSPERSAAVERWLGPLPPGLSFADYIASHDPTAGVLLRLNWEALHEGNLPLELCLDQLPKRVQIKEAGPVLQLSYQPIYKGEALPAVAGQEGRGATGKPPKELSRILVVLSDITEHLERERVEEEQRELMAIFEKILHDRQTFLEFLIEARDQVAQIVSDEPGRDLLVVRRHLHTLKGNSALFGLGGLALLCHELESRLSETTDDVSERDRQELLKRWQQTGARIERLIDLDSPRPIEIHAAEFAAFQRAITEHKSRPELLEMMSAWQLQPIRQRLEHFAEQARVLCRRLSKGDVQVKLECAPVRIQPERWGSFFSAFIHVLRNAVDHGLEPTAERLRLGKPVPGTLMLRAVVEEGQLLIELSDDGRGVDWDKVAARARALGLPAQDRDDLTEALFCDGLSTQEQVTEISGRGVGLGAVLRECQLLGGEVSLTSEPRKGTTWRFRFPPQLLGEALWGMSEWSAQRQSLSFIPRVGRHPPWPVGRPAEDRSEDRGEDCSEAGSGAMSGAVSGDR